MCQLMCKEGQNVYKLTKKNKKIITIDFLNKKIHKR